MGGQDQAAAASRRGPVRTGNCFSSASRSAGRHGQASRGMSGPRGHRRPAVGPVALGYSHALGPCLRALPHHPRCAPQRVPLQRKRRSREEKEYARQRLLSRHCPSAATHCHRRPRWLQSICLWKATANRFRWVWDRELRWVTDWKRPSYATKCLKRRVRKHNCTASGDARTLLDWPMGAWQIVQDHLHHVTSYGWLLASSRRVPIHLSVEQAVVIRPSSFFV